MQVLYFKAVDHEFALHYTPELLSVEPSRAKLFMKNHESTHYTRISSVILSRHEDNVFVEIQQTLACAPKVADCMVAVLLSAPPPTRNIVSVNTLMDSCLVLRGVVLASENKDLRRALTKVANDLSDLYHNVLDAAEMLTDAKEFSGDPDIADRLEKAIEKMGYATSNS